MGYYCKIHRTSVLQSTATGYDCVIALYGEDGLYTTQKTIVYKNVSAASMRRFYRVSNTDQAVWDTREVSYHKFYNIFKR